MTARFTKIYQLAGLFTGTSRRNPHSIGQAGKNLLTDFLVFLPRSLPGAVWSG
ncbi:hypothetical protein [Caenimonas sp. SL110]|uniref:hypothetical protein n=1 Tax=Caenimonas sp. SL110 TaxID=1450524 RepID=UPI00137931C8|nr:hypothetical protein [Caenimonas sp. SL110]